ncbi:MAG: hypothetical protein M3478_07570 [Planctomycetota bacterium]|nr:hypothetical protein [Planctomycetota bacterium]
MQSQSHKPEFTALAARFRHASRVEWRAALGLFAAVLFLALSGPTARPFAVAGLVVAVCTFVYFARRVPKKMCCPKCGQDQLRNKLGTFCPECGAQGLAKEGWLMAAKCPSCNRVMARGKSGRLWKIRACSICGQWIDHTGF